MKSITVLLAAALLAAAVAQRPPHWGGRRRSGFVPEEKSGVKTSHADISLVNGLGLIDQQIDHFAESDSRTFKQRYFFNNEFNMDKKSNVNILGISGEQTASINMITGGVGKPMIQYAQKYGATLYVLEHRYYGDSRPFPDTSTENLKYLSSRQAIEDVASFIKFFNANSSAPEAQKWIVAGGSYAGNLAAWARLKHPELISGAIASSAPLLSQLDFYGYIDRVDKNIKKNPACAAQLRAGIDAIGNLFESPDGRATLDKKFPVEPKLAAYEDLKDNDIVMFFTWVTDVFQGASQYGWPASVENLCKMFTNHPAGYDPVDALADLLKATNLPGFTFNINYTASIEDMMGTAYIEDGTDLFLNVDRLWTWQTCTEFGYFASTDKGDSDNSFGSTIPVNIYVDLCKDVYDVDIDTTKKAIDDTNDYYGARDYFTGTNVVFGYGTTDPWSYLAKQKGTSKHWSVITAEIEGGTHVSDLLAACDANGKCNPYVQQVQKLTEENIGKWLNGPFSAPDSINLTDNVGRRPIWYDMSVKTPLAVTMNAPNPAYMTRAKRSVSSSVQTEKKSAFGRGSGWNQLTGKSYRSQSPSEKAAVDANVVEGTISQPWDHFNPNDERQFQQHFFMNEMYAKSKSAPNFLMIGGEGPDWDGWVSNEGLAWMTYAKEVGATVYMLEHRYFGASKLGTTDLQFLTTSQMLYDVAQFIQIMKRDRGQTGPWITFGGSYHGALAAWSREWFPELVLGAVGSSATVQAKTDFFEYLQVVETVLRAKSDKCADRTQDAFDKLRKLTRDGSGRAQISKKFNLKPDWNDVNSVVPQDHIQNFFVNIYGIFQNVVQNSRDNNSQGHFTVADLCSIMEDEVKYPDSLDAVRNVQKWAYGGDENPETGSDPKDLVDLLKDMKNYIDGHANADGTRPYSDDELGGVLWAWQTCSELGYYQTTDYGYGIFGNPVPLNYFVGMCEQVFGVTMDQIEDGVTRTNYQYGGRSRYSATNVVLPNGNHDPWHGMGILEQGSLDPSVVPILIEGTAHCADMYAARPEDPPQLVDARKTILSNIEKWLN